MGQQSPLPRHRRRSCSSGSQRPAPLQGSAAPGRPCRLQVSVAQCSWPGSPWTGSRPGTATPAPADTAAGGNSSLNSSPGELFHTQADTRGVNAFHASVPGASVYASTAARFEL